LWNLQSGSKLIQTNFELCKENNFSPILWKLQGKILIQRKVSQNLGSHVRKNDDMNAYAWNDGMISCVQFF
jgi:hypothetical protein